ncbi:hypothetical protein VE04_06865 [Pseudogymnoascus sp. 24MN13]|nr:hypothetical protein VE04_06865 [Pseudogymnoascus sp. 24MN13]
MKYSLTFAPRPSSPPSPPRMTPTASQPAPYVPTFHIFFHHRESQSGPSRASANLHPTLQVQCILDATTKATTCGEKEFSCQCTAENQAKITSAAIGCVQDACQPADQPATLSATKALCANPPADEGTGASSSEAPVTPSSTEAPVTPSSTEAPVAPSSTEAAPEPTTTESPTGGAVGEPETVYVTVCSSTQVPGGAAPTGGNPGNGTGTTPTGPATPSFTTAVYPRGWF